jgi:hypothetical protein
MEKDYAHSSEKVCKASKHSLRIMADQFLQDEIMEKYTRLSQESEFLRQRLSMSIMTSDHDYISPTSYALTPIITPERTQNSSFIMHNPHPIPTWSHPSTAEVSDESMLYELNQRIKTTLTELLNCESVKHDKDYRAWVQSKLMDAEHELKRQRRRRSSVVGHETMKAFDQANHYGGHPSGYASWRISV